MDDRMFDMLTRRAAGAMPRATSISAEARKSAGKQAKKKCQQQVGQCMDFFIGSCNGDQECILQALKCCRSLGTCDMFGFFLCIAEQ